MNIKIDLKKDKSKFEEIIQTADVLVESYRPGVLDKLIDIKSNQIQKLILVRLSGYGQSSEQKYFPGHDINYLSYSGVVEEFIYQNRVGLPLIILGDLFNGTLYTFKMIITALINKQINKEGCVIDSSICLNLHRFLLVIDAINQSQVNINSSKIDKIERKFEKYMIFRYSEGVFYPMKILTKGINNIEEISNNSMNLNSTEENSIQPNPQLYLFRNEDNISSEQALAYLNSNKSSSCFNNVKNKISLVQDFSIIKQTKF